ncbi:MAG: hypothetical protein F9K44_15530 [Hyphomicrobiaceae bacterium]|nr:MAG: hypothetical protein F9K44_15530 [Hyphomicrobiaceae bacterium]
MDQTGGGQARKGHYRGTHRLCDPAVTVERLTSLMPAFGITRVANLTGLDRLGIPVVMVCRPNARSSAVFHGKGLDIAAAKASGLMEAIETWHAEHVDLPLRYGSHRQLAVSSQVADVERLPLLPGRSFDRDAQILWVEAKDIAAGGPVLVPFEVVHMDGTSRNAPEARCLSVSTNGLASGNHGLEATSHAICELIERDATSLWHQRSLHEQRATRIDPDTIEDTDSRALLRTYGEAQFDVGLFDLSSDIAVPVVLAMALDRGGEMAHSGLGVGCHPMPEIALLRALTEAAQVRTTYIAGSREDITHDDYSSATLSRRHRLTETLLSGERPSRRFVELGGARFAAFSEEVDWLIGRLRAAGLAQVLVVDLSRPDYGVPVVRALVPGLEGSDHHGGYSPGGRSRAQSAGRRP